MISYKYNIYHSKKTKYLDKMLRECCFVWNHALALQRRYYKLDLSHSSFINKLTYVASKYGITIHKIDKWYPSSKTCECGCINKGLSLRDRTWVCPACGAVNDRDILAARNILRKGISELESKSNSSDINIGVSCVCIQESHLL